MADNITVSEADTGRIVGCDETTGGVLIQRVKATFGADGTATDVSSTDPLPVLESAQTSGGLSTIRFDDVDETEETIKASAGHLYGLELINEDAATIHYVHLYDASSPDTSADTPKMSFKLAAGEARYIDFGKHGVAFSTAITVGALTTIAPSGTGPGANEVYVTAVYK